MSIVWHYSDSWMLGIERNPRNLNLRSNHFYRLKNWIEFSKPTLLFAFHTEVLFHQEFIFLYHVRKGSNFFLDIQLAQHHLLKNLFLLTNLQCYIWHKVSKDTGSIPQVFVSILLWIQHSIK